MRVLAIDPGEKVGWARGVVNERERVPLMPPMDNRVYSEHDALPPFGGVREYRVVPKLEITGHGISTLKDFAIKFYEVMCSDASANDYDVIVYETYRISPAKLKHHVGSDVPTLQLIGMIRLCAWLNPSVKLVGQPPAAMATADKTMPDDIRAIIDKLPKAHDESHDGSALRHLWKWFWTEYV